MKERNKEVKWFLIMLSCLGAVTILGCAIILAGGENEAIKADKTAKAQRQKKTPDSLERDSGENATDNHR